ncbi:MAG: hypothetical protein H0U53_07045 [Actinobacteria bacterium]|nr:hypothetical protein [Actinomycetota bacterium]
MTYAYYIEPLYFEEKVFGRTTVASVEQVKVIGQRFSQLAAQGWEFVRSIDVPVVGKVFKSEERRRVSVALFRKEVAETAP